MSITDQLRAALDTDSRSMTVIAAEIGVHPVSLRKWKAGMMELDSPNLDKLAAALGYEVRTALVRMRGKREKK